MVYKFANRGQGHTGVENGQSGLVHPDHGYLIEVVFIPSQLQQRSRIIRFIEHSGMFEVSEVELTAGAIGSHRREEVLFRGKTYVIHFFVMGYIKELPIS
jgi:hypothetical protein